MGRGILLKAEFDAQRALFYSMLEEVPARTALAEIGFVPTAAESEELRWETTHRGVRLEVFAMPDFFGRIQLTGMSHTARCHQYDERFIPESLPRGRTVQTVLEIWQTAFGQQPTPACLAAGLRYRQFHKDMVRINPGPPTLSVEGEPFRAALRWLAAGHRSADTSALVALDYDHEMLWLRTDRARYACAARGLWMAPIVLKLADLLRLPPSARRGTIRIVQQENQILVNGYPTCAEQAGDGCRD